MPVEFKDGSTTIEGVATLGYRGVVLIVSMNMLIDSNGKLKANRACTQNNLIAETEGFTHKTYKRSRKGLMQARDDLVALKEKCGDLDTFGREHELANKLYPTLALVK